MEAMLEALASSMCQASLVTGFAEDDAPLGLALDCIYAGGENTLAVADPRGAPAAGSDRATGRPGTEGCPGGGRRRRLGGGAGSGDGRGARHARLRPRPLHHHPGLLRGVLALREAVRQVRAGQVLQQGLPGR